MAQYQAGGAVAPRPVLELVKQPLYDTVGIATAATVATFFSQPLGAADATAINGVNKTFSETNLRRAGAIATPQQFDIYATSLKFPVNTTRADHTNFQIRTNYNLEIGQKSYLRVRSTVIPADTSQVVDQLQVAADAVYNGWSLHSNVFDVSIPEELFDQSTGRTFLTGRRVPIHIPSEQQFAVTLELVAAVTLGATRRVECLLWGVLKREVQ